MDNFEINMNDMHDAEWHALRCGCLTASHGMDVCKRGAKGQKLKAYTEYMDTLLAERLTGEVQITPPTKAMQWGIDHEDEAAGAYEIKTGRMLTGNGKVFVPHPSIAWFGASPDRFCGDDGLVEIKCPNCGTHLERLRTREIPEQYKWQIKLQLLCTGRKWCDFVDYDPRFKNKNLELLIIRYEPTEQELKEAEMLCVEFLTEVLENMNLIDNLEDK